MGDNAQGKTNFLESIFYLSTTKSFKAEKEEELIKVGESVLRVEGHVTVSGSESISNNVILGSEAPPESNQEEADSGQARMTDEKGTRLEVALQQTEIALQKRIRANGISRRLIDYSGNLVIVLFAPEDINLVTGSPSLRRAYLDSVLSQVDRSYRKALSNYESVITQKNKLLKRVRDGFAKKDELIYWVDQQILLGTLLANKREEFFNFINSVEKKLGNSSFEYLPNVLSIERLKEYQQKEIDSASSLIGPHRDDFRFKMKATTNVIPAKAGIQNEQKLLLRNKEWIPDQLTQESTGLSPVRDDKEKDLGKYGSRGEQRTAVLDLKILELEYIESKIGDRPILLLDDIFSELDESHRGHVIDLAKMQQTIITTVEWDEYLKKALETSKIYQVKSGKIK